jgi:hypothetical protein
LICRINLLIPLLVAPIAGSSAYAAAPPPRFAEAIKGVLVSGQLLTWVQDNRISFVQVWLTPLKREAPATKLYVALSNTFPPRCHVKNGAFWILSTHCFQHGYFPVTEALSRLEMVDLLKGKAVTAPGSGVGKIEQRFAYPTAGDLVRIVFSYAKFEAELYTDVLPVGRYEVRQFVLNNVRGKAVPRGSAGLLSAYGIDYNRKDRTTPFWSFRVERYKSAWDAKRQEWQQGRWEEEEKLPVVFKEPFQALGKGEDYFFVTRSGQLFVARKPAKGKQRSVKCVWSDSDRRILGIISNADADRHFLFCAAKRGERPTFFELSAKPAPVKYDPGLAPLPQKVDEYQLVRHYARVLLALKKIKGK